MSTIHKICGTVSTPIRITLDISEFMLKLLDQAETVINDVIGTEYDTKEPFRSMEFDTNTVLIEGTVLRSYTETVINGDPLEPPDSDIQIDPETINIKEDEIRSGLETALTKVITDRIKIQIHIDEHRNEYQENE